MKTGLVRVGYSKIRSQTETAVTYDTPTYFAAAAAGGREYKATAQGNVKTIDANSQTIYEAELNGGYEIELTLIDIIDSIAEEWLGFELCQNGTLEKASNKEKPRFALILSDNDTSDVGKTEIFYNCVCTSRPDITGKTTEQGNWDEQFPVYKITARPRLSDNNIRLTISGTDKLTEIPEPQPKTTTP